MTSLLHTCCSFKALVSLLGDILLINIALTTLLSMFQYYSFWLSAHFLFFFMKRKRTDSNAPGLDFHQNNTLVAISK